MAFAEIESVFLDSEARADSEARVPESFPDQVMKRIQILTAASASPSGRKVTRMTRIWRSFKGRPSRIQFAYASAVLLVLLVLAPSAS